MLSLVHRLRDEVARRQVLKSSSVSVSSSARVNWRGIGQRPPSRLEIGERSIFSGTITSDRNGSCVVIGKNTFVGNSMIVTAQRVEIGDDVLISWGCTIVDHDSHHVEWASRMQDVRNYYLGIKSWEGVAVSPVIVGDKVWIGFNVIILKGVTVGPGAVIAAGSVVTRDVPAFTLVGGNPARPIRALKGATT